jgi:tetratricopeptide (TPR) repeat protein
MVRSGRYSEALTSLDQALRLGAEPYDCYLRQVQVYQSLGRPREALTVAEKAIALRPAAVAPREAMVALYLQTREFERAIAASREILRIAPRHMAARHAMGAAYMSIGDFDAAMRIANEMTRLEPDEPLHRIRRAMLLEHKGETRLALEDLQRALDFSRDPDLVMQIREHMETLDLVELQHIMMLAQDDAVFRVRIVREPQKAIAERGFWLSEWGLRRLEEITSDMFTELDTDPASPMYH